MVVVRHSLAGLPPSLGQTDCVQIWWILSPNRALHICPSTTNEISNVLQEWSLCASSHYLLKLPAAREAGDGHKDGELRHGIHPRAVCYGFNKSLLLPAEEEMPKRCCGFIKNALISDERRKTNQVWSPTSSILERILAKSKTIV